MPSFILSLILLVAAVLSPSSWAVSPRPKLIVMVVFDQFRADYLMRFESRFLPATNAKGTLGGFGYLMSKGAYFPYAYYDILQSMTGPGHATVLTGAYPYQAGIPTNDWFSQETQDFMYCAEDPASPWVGAPLPPHAGSSPKNLFASTVGDELKNAGYPSRVVSLAIKDRAAILMGGHAADLALWLNPATSQWVSSRFYLPGGKLPPWMIQLNDSLAKRKGEPLTLSGVGKGTGFTALNPEAWPHDSRISSSFPHQTSVGERSSLLLPFGEQITEEAAESAIEAFGLGRGKSSDLLAVSFSSHDYLGHAFGPNSREMEEMTVAEDRVLSRLLNFLQKRVPGGLANVVVVLTGDHGVAPIPEYATDHQEAAGRIDERKLAASLEQKLEKKYGPLSPGQKWLPLVHEFNFYLNRRAIQAKGLSVDKVESDLKPWALEEPGIAYALTSAELEAGKLPPGMHARQAQHTYYPGRSADLILIPKPLFIPSPGDPVVHITGYSYDRTVPLIFSGFGIRPGRYATKAEIVDIAPTLTYLAGTIPPDLSEGRVLSEILK